MCSFVDAEATMALHLPPELETEFRAHFERGPVTQDGRTMQGYSSIPPELTDDVAALRGWFDRSWAWHGTLDPNPTKKRHRERGADDRLSAPTGTLGPWWAPGSEPR